MADTLFSSAGYQAATLALNGLALRQEIVGRNLANVDTPGYQAQAVSFEDTLKNETTVKAALALTVTHPVHLLPKSNATDLVRIAARPGGSARADGNTVDVDQELTEMAETGIRYQAMSQFVSGKLLLLKSIANGR